MSSPHHSVSDRRVLLMIIDGLTPRVVEPAIDRGELPFLEMINSRGGRKRCASIFPSITPAATASLVTGATPRRHGVQGAFWYDTDRSEFMYFGDAPRIVLREGVNTYFDDYLRTLNDRVLSADTIFEQVQRSGRTAANLNLMWRRGVTSHVVNQPLLFKLLPGVTLAQSVSGPDWLFLGDFVKSQLPGGEEPKPPGGPTRRFGFNDDATLAQLGSLLRSGANPALTVAYFPDNDFRSHAKGPDEALDELRELDGQLLELLGGEDGVDRLLETTEVFVVGDHGHDNLLSDAKHALVRLDDLLDDWSQALLGDKLAEEDELAICTNMRAAQIVLSDGVEPRRVIDKLLSHEGVDLVIRSAGGCAIEVETRNRGRLVFCEAESPNAELADSSVVCDANGRKWRRQGDLSAIDASVDGARLHYGNYPDALWRLAEGSPAFGNAIWLSATPGREFTTSEIPSHPAGSHGSLHANDSDTLLIATAGIELLRDTPSIADVPDLCLKRLGIDPANSSLAAGVAYR